ncbi:MAG: flagellar export protein FliJ [Thioalkalispiraceae bacterium]|jgi:flagellar FliJ protein
MARRKSDRFATLQKLAGKYEDMAALALGKSASNVDAQKARLAELKQFREEYTKQFYASGAEGISGAAIQSYQNFIRQLDLAIEQQTQTVAAAEVDKSTKKDVWQDKHRTTRIYKKSREQFAAKEQKEKDRREQKEQDDRTRHTLK